MTSFPLLLFATGLAIGLLVAAAVWGFARTAMAQTLRQLAAREETERRLHESLSVAREEQARLAAELDGERRAGAGKLAILQDAEAKLREAFASLSSEALRRNNDSFLALARTSLSEFQQTARADLDGRQKAIEDLVQPLKLSLTQVDAKLQQVEQTRAGSHAALAEQLRSLGLAQQTLQTETGRLVQALRSPNVRGQWGELQLRRVVEAAGMLEYCDFDLKESVATADGRLTPDMIVRLPGGKQRRRRRQGPIVCLPGRGRGRGGRGEDCPDA